MSFLFFFHFQLDQNRKKSDGARPRTISNEMVEVRVGYNFLESDVIVKPD